MNRLKHKTILTYHPTLTVKFETEDLPLCEFYTEITHFSDYTETVFDLNQIQKVLIVRLSRFSQTEEIWVHPKKKSRCTEAKRKAKLLSKQ